MGTESSTKNAANGSTESTNVGSNGCTISTAKPSVIASYTAKPCGIATSTARSKYYAAINGNDAVAADARARRQCTTAKFECIVARNARGTRTGSRARSGWT